jgi:hypothetical protein
MFTMPAGTYTSPAGSWTGMAHSVQITGAGVPAGFFVNTLTNAVTATTDTITGLTFTIAGSAVGAGINELMVDLNADANGNIISLRIDGILAPNPATQLSQHTILMLNFPNNVADYGVPGAAAPASQVQLKATIIVQ